MIDTNIKIHDKFSFEMKTSFVASRQYYLSKDINEFSINTWIFVPDSLDINRFTYSKEQFYKDSRSNIRLITPIFSLKSICIGEDCPLVRLQCSLKSIIEHPNDEKLLEAFTFQIRMFACIFKSAARNKSSKIEREEYPEKTGLQLDEFIAACNEVKKQYRLLWFSINKAVDLPKDAKEHFSFGDMFIGNVCEQHAYALMRRFEKKPFYNEIKQKLYDFVNEEIAYKKKMNYSTLDINDPTNNYLVVMRRNILKKFIESDLFIDTKKTKDGALVQQLVYAMAAGISMIFATIIAFTAQSRYGNFTIPLFFALVVSYAFKDRIKELLRYYLSKQIDKKYFDSKRELEMLEQNIGWTKDGFAHVSGDKVPERILSMRKRTPLVEAENKIYNEKILLYKKLVNLSVRKATQYKGYPFIGINDISRINLSNFVQKMDNALVPLYVPDEKAGYIGFKGERVYALHLIVDCHGHESTYSRKYRLLLNREGIKEIVEIKE